MTDQTAAIEVWARVLCAAGAHVHGYPTWQQLPTAPGPSGRSQDDYRKVAAWLLPRMTVADPAEQAPATDRAAGVAEAIRTFPFDNFGMDDVSFALEDAPEAQEWVPALADAVLAALPAPADRAATEERAARWETAALKAGREVDRNALRIYMAVADDEQAELRRMAAEAQQPSLAVEDCTCIPVTRQDGTPRYCQPGDTVDMISGWEIGGDCPHHRDAVKTQQPVTRQSCACGQDGCEYCDVDDEPQDDGDVFELPGPEVVAYRNTDRPGVLLCRAHGDGWWGLTPLTSDDLPDGGTCTYGDPADPDDVCGRDVLIPQQPKEARS